MAKHGKNKRHKGAAAGETRVRRLLRSHFAPLGFDALSVAERKFPYRVRADLQRALDGLLAGGVAVGRFCGVRKEYTYDGIDFPGLLADSNYPAEAVPPQYEEVDVGGDRPVRCLKNGLWLLADGDFRYAVLLSPAFSRGETSGVVFQLAAPIGGQGPGVADRFFRHLEDAVAAAGSYRGKILSLDAGDSYSGRSTGITVHSLPPVGREQVILPAKTLDLLDRNVIGFVRDRPKLARLGQATKKGLLFYGPPGTGKTHTLRYLAASLPGHTTLLLSAEQVGLLGEYMTLARLLQPSLVVIEDADLIARDREAMHSPCEEVMLNKLLNEMDGLKEDAAILFVLTTNRPEALEAALAARPGRVDQAIEFPLPDDAGRDKLLRLYARGVILPADVAGEVVKRTAGVSGAFIKELVRRAVQFHLERADSGDIALADVDRALDEMLFGGGPLNRKLLGAADGAGG